MSVVDVSLFAAWWRSRHLGRPPDNPPSTAGALIGFTGDTRPITYPPPSLEHSPHGAIFAGSGVGKTALAASWFIQELVASNTVTPAHQQTWFVVDAKGDLIHGIISGISRSAPERFKDVYILDPFSLASFPFNLNRLALGSTPLDIRSAQLASLVSTVSTATGSQAHLGVGSRQLDVLNNTLLAALATEHPAANPLWALDALTTPGGLKQLAAVTTSNRAKNFLLTAQLSDELKSSCSARLRSALSATASLERLMSASTSIQFSELLAPGKIVLCDLGRPTGGLVSLTKFYANVLVRLGIEYLMERISPFPGHHVRIIIDECQIVAPVLSDIAEQILTTGRSRAVSVTLITQQTALLASASDSLLPVIWSNCPNKLIGRLSASDATLISREVAPSRGTGEAISMVQRRFSSSVATLRDREFFWLKAGSQPERMTSAPVDLPAWHRATEEQSTAITAAKNRLALPADQPPRVTLAQASPASPRNPRNKPVVAVQAAHQLPSDRSEQTPKPRPAIRPRSKWG